MPLASQHLANGFRWPDAVTLARPGSSISKQAEVSKNLPFGGIEEVTQVAVHVAFCGWLGHPVSGVPRNGTV